MRRFGIDLGTTNTCIFHANSSLGGTVEDFMLSRVEIHYENTGRVTNPPLSQSMPSAIYGRENPEAEDGYDIYLGAIAIREAAEDNVPEIINTKRLLCREEPDRKIAYNLTAKDIAQKLLEGCFYSIEKSFTKNQIKASQFCITQPAAFGLFASRSIQDAAEPAGFNNAKPLREPISALLSFLYDKLKDQDSAIELLKKQEDKGGRLLTLVCDIGGGTTDVTIQEIQISGSEDYVRGSLICTGYKIQFLHQAVDDSKEDQAPVATANQEPAFGGFDFDKVIAQHVIKEWNEQYKAEKGYDCNWNSPGASNTVFWLYERIKDFKNSLSNYGEEQIVQREEMATLDGVQMTCKYNSAMVYEWTRDLCEPMEGGKETERTVYGIIEDTIRRSGYKIEDIDYFFVTGGMSSFWPIRNMLKRRFNSLHNNGALVFSKIPLDDIARGAAVCDSFFEVDMPESVLYADLMVDDPCGEPRILVEKNHELPASSVVNNLFQLRNPAYLYVDVLQGLGTKDCSLKRLRRLRKRLPNGKITPIGTKVSVKWKIDIHQAMDVELIVHDPNGEYTIPLLQLIKDVDLTEGDRKDG